jgi:hypothetical protein
LICIKSLQLLRHRSDIEPPTGSGDGGLLPAGDYYNNIFVLPAISHHDATLNHLKSLRSARPFHTGPMRPWCRRPPPANCSPVMDLDLCPLGTDVNGSFVKGLVVRLLL